MNGISRNGGMWVIDPFIRERRPSPPHEVEVPLPWVAYAIGQQLAARRMGGRIFGRPRISAKVWLRFHRAETPIEAKQNENVTTIGPTEISTHTDGGYLFTAPGGWIIDGVTTLPPDPTKEPTT